MERLFSKNNGGSTFFKQWSRMILDISGKVSYVQGVVSICCVVAVDLVVSALYMLVDMLTFHDFRETYLIIIPHLSKSRINLLFF